PCKSGDAARRLGPIGAQRDIRFAGPGENLKQGLTIQPHPRPAGPAIPWPVLAVATSIPRAHRPAAPIAHRGMIGRKGRGEAAAGPRFSPRSPAQPSSTTLLNLFLD